MYFNSKKILDKSFLFWVLTIFISSFVVFTTIKGTTPAFIFAFLSVPIVTLFGGSLRKQYFYLMIKILLVFVAIITVSQLYLYLFPIKVPSNLIFTSDVKDVLLRSTLITQSLYFFVSILLFLFVLYFYKPAIHDVYIKYSLYLFIAYGFYTWIYFILFGEDGDIISNRVFGDDILLPSHFQRMTISKFTLMRFTSLSGEPSMYVFTILPIFIYLINRESIIFLSFILISLILTFSSTLVSGIFVYIVVYLYTMEVSFKKKLTILFTIVFSIMLVLILLPQEIYIDLISQIILDKVNQDNLSGIERFESFQNHLDFFANMPLFLQLFGMGHGYIRSTDFFSTLIVNNGIISLLIIFYIMIIYPNKSLSHSIRNSNIKASLIVIFFIAMVSVSEYSYPTIWLVLGIAYNQIYREKKYIL